MQYPSNTYAKFISNGIQQNAYKVQSPQQFSNRQYSPPPNVTVPQQFSTQNISKRSGTPPTNFEIKQEYQRKQNMQRQYKENNNANYEYALKQSRGTYYTTSNGESGNNNVVLQQQQQLQQNQQQNNNNYTNSKNGQNSSIRYYNTFYDKNNITPFNQSGNKFSSDNNKYQSPKSHNLQCSQSATKQFQLQQNHSQNNNNQQQLQCSNNNSSQKQMKLQQGAIVHIASEQFKQANLSPASKNINNNICTNQQQQRAQNMLYGKANALNSQLNSLQQANGSFQKQISSSREKVEREIKANQKSNQEYEKLLKEKNQLKEQIDNYQYQIEQKQLQYSNIPDIQQQQQRDSEISTNLTSIKGSGEQNINSASKEQVQFINQQINSLKNQINNHGINQQIRQTQDQLKNLNGDMKVQNKQTEFDQIYKDLNSQNIFNGNDLQYKIKDIKKKNDDLQDQQNKLRGKIMDEFYSNSENKSNNHRYMHSNSKNNYNQLSSTEQNKYENQIQKLQAMNDYKDSELQEVKLKYWNQQRVQNYDKKIGDQNQQEINIYQNQNNLMVKGQNNNNIINNNMEQSSINSWGIIQNKPSLNNSKEKIDIKNKNYNITGNNNMNLRYQNNNNNELRNNKFNDNNQNNIQEQQQVYSFKNNLLDSRQSKSLDQVNSNNNKSNNNNNNQDPLNDITYHIYKNSQHNQPQQQQQQYQSLGGGNNNNTNTKSSLVNYQISIIDQKQGQGLGMEARVSANMSQVFKINQVDFQNASAIEHNKSMKNIVDDSKDTISDLISQQNQNNNVKMDQKQQQSSQVANFFKNNNQSVLHLNLEEVTSANKNKIDMDLIQTTDTNRQNSQNGSQSQNLQFSGKNTCHATPRFNHTKHSSQYQNLKINCENNNNSNSNSNNNEDNKLEDTNLEYMYRNSPTKSPKKVKYPLQQQQSGKKSSKNNNNTSNNVTASNSQKLIMLQKQSNNISKNISRNSVLFQLQEEFDKANRSNSKRAQEILNTEQVLQNCRLEQNKSKNIAHPESLTNFNDDFQFNKDQPKKQILTTEIDLTNETSDNVIINGQQQQNNQNQNQSKLQHQQLIYETPRDENIESKKQGNISANYYNNNNNGLVYDSPIQIYQNWKGQNSSSADNIKNNKKRVKKATLVQINEVIPPSRNKSKTSNNNEMENNEAQKLINDTRLSQSEYVEEDQLHRFLKNGKKNNVQGKNNNVKYTVVQVQNQQYYRQFNRQQNKSLGNPIKQNNNIQQYTTTTTKVQQLQSNGNQNQYQPYKKINSCNKIEQQQQLIPQQMFTFQQQQSQSPQAIIMLQKQNMKQQYQQVRQNANKSIEDHMSPNKQKPSIYNVKQEQIEQYQQQLMQIQQRQNNNQQQQQQQVKKVQLNLQEQNGFNRQQLSPNSVNQGQQQVQNLSSSNIERKNSINGLQLVAVNSDNRKNEIQPQQKGVQVINTGETFNLVSQQNIQSKSNLSQISSEQQNNSKSQFSNSKKSLQSIQNVQQQQQILKNNNINNIMMEQKRNSNVSISQNQESHQSIVNNNQLFGIQQKIQNNNNQQQQQQQSSQSMQSQQTGVQSNQSNNQINSQQQQQNINNNKNNNNNGAIWKPLGGHIQQPVNKLSNSRLQQQPNQLQQQQNNNNVVAVKPSQQFVNRQCASYSPPSNKGQVQQIQQQQQFQQQQQPVRYTNYNNTNGRYSTQKLFNFSPQPTTQMNQSPYVIRN